MKILNLWVGDAEMLDATKKGFVEEMVIGLSLTILFSWSIVNYTWARESFTTSFIIAFISSCIIFGGTLRIIRWAIVFKNPGYLLLLNLTAFALIMISVQTLASGLTLDNILLATFLLFFVVIYYGYLLYLKKTGKFAKGTPPIRIKILLRNLTRAQKITLIFPDRYIKYLETGDERYLKGEE